MGAHTATFPAQRARHRAVPTKPVPPAPVEVADDDWVDPSVSWRSRTATVALTLGVITSLVLAVKGLDGWVIFPMSVATIIGVLLLLDESEPSAARPAAPAVTPPAPLQVPAQRQAPRLTLAPEQVDADDADRVVLITGAQRAVPATGAHRARPATGAHRAAA